MHFDDIYSMLHGRELSIVVYDYQGAYTDLKYPMT
jgi:hypothetical protein